MSKDATHLSTPLENAWNRFATYDHNAGEVQKRFYRVRTLMLVVGVAATALAISYSHLEDKGTNARPGVEDWRFFVWLPVMLAPILGSALSAGAAKLARGARWVHLRGAAEAIKRDIYHYRCRLGAYSPKKEGRRDEKLAAAVAQATARLMDTDVLSVGLKVYRGKVPPEYGAAPDDDGFSDMGPDQYLEWRLVDQQEYFRRKALQFDRQHHRFNWSVVLLGGAGTLLAALGYEIWVPVSVGVAAAFMGYLELRKVESTLAGYNRAALELDNIALWWSGLTADGKADTANFEALVKRTETVLASENSSWVQQMQKAMEDVEEDGKD